MHNIPHIRGCSHIHTALLQSNWCRDFMNEKKVGSVNFHSTPAQIASQALFAFITLFLVSCIIFKETMKSITYERSLKGVEVYG